MDIERKTIRVKRTTGDPDIMKLDHVKPIIPFVETRGMGMADCDTEIHSVLYDPISNEWIIDFTATYKSFSDFDNVLRDVEITMPIKDLLSCDDGDFFSELPDNVIEAMQRRYIKIADVVWPELGDITFIVKLRATGNK